MLRKIDIPIAQVIFKQQNNLVMIKNRFNEIWPGRKTTIDAVKYWRKRIVHKKCKIY